MGAIIRISYWILRLINLLLTLTGVVFLLGFIFQFIPQANNYFLVQKINTFTQPAIQYVGSLIPIQVGGYEYGSLIIILVILIVTSLIGRVIDALTERLIIIRKRQKRAAEAVSQEPTETTGDGRASLLKQWISIKDQLEKSRRLLCFLSVDIIGSTRMKENEDSHLIEYTFAEYKKFVEEILNANNVWKEAWTPDGLMCAFLTVDDAVKAGKEIITGLEAFNKYVNQLKTPISVRCGINYGTVVFDIKARMEEVTDRVIDIAGHLQKSAEPDTIWLSKEVLESLSPTHEREGYQAVQVKIDNQDVVEWKKPG